MSSTVFLLFRDQRAKKERQRQPWRREERGFVITPAVTEESRAGRGEGEWLTVAPGYLEEGLLHSEAGQQN